MQPTRGPAAARDPGPGDAANSDVVTTDGTSSDRTITDVDGDLLASGTVAAERARRRAERRRGQDEPPGWRLGWLDLAALAALALFVVLFFWPLVTGHMFSTVGGVQNAIFPWAAHPTGIPGAIQDDSSTLSYGWQAFAQTALRSGAFPFWDASTFGGYALFANGSSAFANPIKIALALLVEPGPAHEALSILYLAGGGVFAYLLGRELRLRRWGSLLAATAWMLSSWNLGWLHLEVVSPVITFFPAGLLTVRLALRKQALGWTVLAAAALTWLLISTHLLFALVTWFIVMLYGAGLVLVPVLVRRGRDVHASLGRAARLAGAALLSLGLGAPVLLPTWLMLNGSQRTPITYAELTAQWVGRPRTFLNTFKPEPLPLTVTTFNAELVFAGTATAVLALVGLFVLRRPAAALGRGLAAGLFLVAVGTPFTWLAFTFIPGMDVFRPYTRLAMWWPLAIGLLGGVGLDLVVDKLGAWQRWAGAALAVVVVAGTGAQLLDYGRDINPPFPERSSAYLFPDTPLLEALHADGTNAAGWPQRTVGLRGDQALGWTPSMFFANTNLAARVDSATGYDSAFPERSTDVVRVLVGEPVESVLATGLPAAYAPVLDGGRARLDLLGRVGVSQVAAVPGITLNEPWATPLVEAGATEAYRGADGTVVDLPEQGPRLVGGTTLTTGADEALTTFVGPGFDHTTDLLLEADEADRLGDDVTLPDDSGPAGRIVEASRGINTAHLVVEADRPAWLVIPDGWDAGWTAEVGGTDATVLRGDYYQQAVLVPAGTTEVALTYRPQGWRAGVAIGLISLLTCVTGTAVSWRRRRRSGRSAAA